MDFPLHARVEAQLLAPGGPFAFAPEPVLGETLPVFTERPRSLRALLEASAGFGDREALAHDGLRLGFREHAGAVASVARALAERFGVRPGDRVAILAANRPEWLLSWWATVSLGAVAVGMNAWWTRDEIRYGLEDCEPRVLVGDARRLARASHVTGSLPVVEMETQFEALRRHAPGAALPNQPIDEDDPACILYTSGTTGRPKGAVHTHRNILAVVRLGVFHGTRLALIGAAQGATAPALAPCALVNAPLFHVSGLYTGAVTPLATGVKTVWMSGRFDAERVMECIARERVTSWSPLGPMFTRLASHPALGRHDLSSVRQLGSGGAPLSAALLQRMREVFPNARGTLGLGYGLTEATGMATIHFGAELEHRPGSVGRALPTIAIEIRDAQGRALPEGDAGEICLRSALVMRGYWRKPEATAEVLAPGRWLRTGDLGRLEDGYLHVDARARDLILRGGENVHPAEIELRLESHPSVAEAAVLGADHEELGQEVMAVVVPRDGAAPDPATLARWVGESLAYYKVPTRWQLRSEPLPRNAAGKVLKQLLRPDAGPSRFEEE